MTSIFDMIENTTSLQAADGSFVDLESVFKHKKIIGLYFSAHWCGPCRSFTPRLVQFYNERKAAAADDFEIIFVSSDNTRSGFNDYSASMPWLSLPYQNRDVAEELNDCYKISGIPALVLLSADGKLRSKQGRDLIYTNPGNFPWGISL